MSLPSLLVTGASGFIGRHVVAAFQRQWRVHAFGRRTAAEARAPEGPNITWHQVDLGVPETMDAVFKRIAADGGVDAVRHLAAHYDFVPWFITESRADIAGVQKLDAPVKSVLLETKFSGDQKVEADTPIWKLDVK